MFLRTTASYFRCAFFFFASPVSGLPVLCLFKTFAWQNNYTENNNHFFWHGNLDGLSDFFFTLSSKAYCVVPTCCRNMMLLLFSFLLDLVFLPCANRNISLGKLAVRTRGYTSVKFNVEEMKLKSITIKILALLGSHR